MKAAFRKTTYFPSCTDMLAEHEGSWDLLKIYMCRAWGVEEAFDSHSVWEIIRGGSTVLMDGYLYCAYDDAQLPDGGEFELFSGELVMLDSDAEEL